MNRKKAASLGHSFRWGVISSLCMYSERRQALRWHQLDLDLPPFAIPSCIGWTVSEHILVAQLYSNLCSHVCELIRIIDAEHASAGDVGNLVQQIRPIAFFGSGRTIIEQANGINLDIRFLYQRFDLGIGISAAIIAAVRDDQQRLLLVVRLLHLLDPHIDRVEESGAPLSICKHQTALNVFNRIGEIANELWLVAEANHEELVIRIGGLKKLDDCLLALVDLVPHASAEVKDDAERQRSVFAGERPNLLTLAAFLKVEVFAFETSHQAIHRISNGYRNQHQSSVYPERTR